MAKAFEVEGLRELNKAVRRASDQGLRKRLGSANKQVGQFIITKLHPRPVPEAVGQGAGATVRPSATMREVLLKAGGKHRTHAPMQQWGKRQVGSASPPQRPFILGTAQRHRREIENEYMKAIREAMQPAFWKVD